MWMLECLNNEDSYGYNSFFVFFEHCEDALEVAKKAVRYKANWEELKRPSEIYLYRLEDNSVINGFDRMTHSSDDCGHYACWSNINEKIMK